MEQGQSIVLIALAFIGLVAFIGLAIDTGILFIGYGHLRRATDAAALAAAAQFRENYTVDQLNNSATEFLRLNGVDLNNASATVYTCATDATLCQTGSTPKRKLVRVQASSKVNFSFLPILGITDTTITADANGEAATLDLVLIIDNSESMSTGDDPSVCNLNNTCQPFADVKSAAKSLVDKILNKPATDEEDRIAIVEFSNGWQQGGNNKGTYVVTGGDGWTNNKTDAEAAIDGLKVYDPGQGCTETQARTLGESGFIGPCRGYYGTTYSGVSFCPLGFNHTDPTTPVDYSTCPTTNIGGGLLLGANQFGRGIVRPESVWVEVLLTDGVPNATCSKNAAGATCWPDPAPNATETDHTKPYALPIQYCPNITRLSTDPLNPNQQENQSSVFCIDNNAYAYHSTTSAAYDAKDYAYDQAKFAACDPVTPATGCGGIKGQGAIIFTIGLGQGVSASVTTGGPHYGETVLRKIASIGDDGDPNSVDPCASVTGLTTCGNYFYSPTSSQLVGIFDEIASRIFTRITK